MRVLIHGALGAASQMEPLRDALGKDVPTCLVELEGHGNTPSSHETFTVDRFAENVREAMAAGGIRRADVFGYSMGGYVALYLAAHAPELVASVTTLGTKLAWTPEVAAREVSRLDPTIIRAKVPAFAVELDRRHTVAGGWEGVLAKTAVLMTALGGQPVVDSDLLERIEAPVRLMVGDRDTVVTIEETRANARAVARGELYVLPGTPHPFEQVSLRLLVTLLSA